MSMIGAAYCIHCDHKVEYCVRSQRISVDIRGIVSTYDELVACKLQDLIWEIGEIVPRSC